MGSLNSYADELGRHGLMIPPFSNMGIVDELVQILRKAPMDMDEQLTAVLSRIYTPAHLAAMVVSRYAHTKVIDLYRDDQRSDRGAFARPRPHSSRRSDACH